MQRIPSSCCRWSPSARCCRRRAARNLSDVGFAAPLLICNEDHRFLVDEQLRQVGIEPQAILLEPLARNTGPAIAAAALWLLARDPDALMLVQPSDHVVADTEAFHRAVMRGLAAAQAGRLVTFGVKPTRPDTGYGYIQAGAALTGADGVLAVDRFVEKPDRATAERFLAGGNFLWNSGIFLLSRARLSSTSSRASTRRCSAPASARCRPARRTSPSSGSTAPPSPKRRRCRSTMR